MTVIVGITTGKRTWIGADRRSTFGSEPFDHVDKLVRCGPWWIGAAGTSRTSYLMRAHAAALAEAPDAWAFTLALRTLLREDGYKSEADAGKAERHDFSGVLARAHEIYLLTQDFAPMRWPINEACACGSGGDNALGAGFAMLGGRQGAVGDGGLVLQTMIEAAIAYENRCGGGPNIQELKP